MVYNSNSVLVLNVSFVSFAITIIHYFIAFVNTFDTIYLYVSFDTAFDIISERAYIALSFWYTLIVSNSLLIGSYIYITMYKPVLLHFLKKYFENYLVASSAFLALAFSVFTQLA